MPNRACVYCGKRLTFFQQFSGDGKFCSAAHRKQYQEEMEKLALESLARTEQVTKRHRELAAEESSALATETPAVVPATAEEEIPPLAPAVVLQPAARTGEVPRRRAFDAAFLAGILLPGPGLASIAAAWSSLCPAVPLVSARPRQPATAAVSSFGPVSVTGGLAMPVLAVRHDSYELMRAAAVPNVRPQPAGLRKRALEPSSRRVRKVGAHYLETACPDWRTRSPGARLTVLAGGIRLTIGARAGAMRPVALPAAGAFERPTIAQPSRRPTVANRRAGPIDNRPAAYQSALRTGMLSCYGPLVTGAAAAFPLDHSELRLAAGMPQAIAGLAPHPGVRARFRNGRTLVRGTAPEAGPVRADLQLPSVDTRGLALVWAAPSPAAVSLAALQVARESEQRPRGFASVPIPFVRCASEAQVDGLPPSRSLAGPVMEWRPRKWRPASVRQEPAPVLPTLASVVPRSDPAVATGTPRLASGVAVRILAAVGQVSRAAAEAEAFDGRVWVTSRPAPELALERIPERADGLFALALPPASSATFARRALPPEPEFALEVAMPGRLYQAAARSLPVVWDSIRLAAPCTRLPGAQLPTAAEALVPLASPRLPERLANPRRSTSLPFRGTLLQRAHVSAAQGFPNRIRGNRPRAIPGDFGENPLAQVPGFPVPVVRLAATGLAASSGVAVPVEARPPSPLALRTVAEVPAARPAPACVERPLVRRPRTLPQLAGRLDVCPVPESTPGASLDLRRPYSPDALELGELAATVAGAWTSEASAPGIAGSPIPVAMDCARAGTPERPLELRWIEPGKNGIFVPQIRTSTLRPSIVFLARPSGSTPVVDDADGRRSVISIADLRGAAGTPRETTPARSNRLRASS